MHLPLLAIAAPTAVTANIGKGLMSEKIDTKLGKFGSLFGKSLNSGANCLGNFKNSGLVKGLQNKKMGLGDLKDMLASFKKALLQENGGSVNNLILDHPDERALTDFLKQCGFSDSEVETIKNETKTGEGQYSLEILFALLQKQPSCTNVATANQFGSSGSGILAEAKGNKTTDESSKESNGGIQLSPSETAALNGILNELRSASDIPNTSQQVIQTDKTGPNLESITKDLKELPEQSFQVVPLEDRHKTILMQLLQRSGLQQDAAQEVITGSGLGDNQLSLEKLAAVFEKASKELDNVKFPRDREKINSGLEKLISTLRNKTSQESVAHSDLDLVSVWQDKWLDKYKKDLSKADSGRLSQLVTDPAADTSLIQQNLPAADNNNIAEYASYIKLHGPLDSQMAAGLQTKSDSHQVQGAAPLLSPGLVYPQVVDGVLKSVRLREDKLVIKLVPPELGEMKINLAMKDGQLHATFFIDDRRVKEMMESSLPQLRTALSEQGIQIGECNVELNQDFRHFFSGDSDRNTSSPSWHFSDEPEAGVRQETASPYIRAESLDGIDLFA